ncbi:MAG: ABC transporter permease [Lachnospiraceae bacterium]|nr:ABC transporter permease [Lachnospiraceae bacterium]
MNLGLRAVLHTARKWKKTLLVFCLLLAITTLVLSGLAIADAQEEQAEELRGTTGASFTVERNLSTGGWSNGSGGSYSIQEFLTEDMIQRIATVDGVEGYDASLITLPHIFNDKGKELTHENYSFYNYGSYNSQYHELFLSGRFEVAEGSHITDDMANGVMISRELADWNDLKVGDTLTGIYYPQNNTPAVDMEIVGIFDVAADKDDQVNMYDDSSYYDYSSFVFCSMEAAEGLLKGWGEKGEGISEAYYYVTDAAQLDNVIKKAQSISSINWNNFKLTANDQVYQNISNSLSDTGTLITTLIVVITAVSMALIVLILFMSVRSRNRETGILLAVGIAKPAVILQYVLETLLVAVVAFPLAYLSSKQVAGILGTLFDKAAENVIVTPEHFLLVAGGGGILLVAAALISCIPAMRLKPKEILSQME